MIADNEPIGLHIGNVDLAKLDAFAQKLAQELKSGDCVCLFGALGVGKTRFAKALLAALGCEQTVVSPSFNLVLPYDAPGGTVWHYDLYRVQDTAELEELGIEEALSHGITLIEWPERLGHWRPPDRLEIHLHDQADGSEARAIAVFGYGRQLQQHDALKAHYGHESAF